MYSFRTSEKGDRGVVILSEALRRMVQGESKNLGVNKQILRSSRPWRDSLRMTVILFQHASLHLRPI
jgi:hypothetical protein